jgi:dermatan/chondrotin sulfate uronyl 2-O-sulfotransferase UST
MAQVRDFFGSDVRVKAVKDPQGGLVERRAEVPYAEQRTGPDLPTSIIFNRVPKCASSTVARVVQTLARANHFSYLHSLAYRRPNVSALEEEVLVRDLGQMPRPWLYDRHVQVLDFAAYQHRMPAYINVFREPIARRQSLYYHLHRHDRDVMPFEDYVRRDETHDTGVIAPLRYFCRITECRGGDEQELLQIAKQNVERYYTVVGITEDLESFFQLLEHYFPEMFRGAVDVYRTTAPQNVDVNKASHALTNATTDLLRKQLGHEYEFYEFVKQRFMKAKRLANIV